MNGPTLHRFIGLSSRVIFIDIIGPPYDDENRHCTYYEDLSEIPSESHVSKSSSDSFDLNGVNLPLNVCSEVYIRPANIDFVCKTKLYEHIK